MRKRRKKRRRRGRRGKEVGKADLPITARIDIEPSRFDNVLLLFLLFLLLRLFWFFRMGMVLC